MRAASLGLKVNIVSLTGEHKSMADRKVEAEYYVQVLKERLKEFRKQGTPSTPKKSNKTSSTVIPFFDIEFKNILTHIVNSAPQMGEVKESELTLKTVDENLELFTRIFGIPKDTVSMSELRNQSMQGLGSVFY